MRCVLLTFAFLLLAGTVLAKRKQRIINGTEPRLYEFPSLVSILRNSSHYCGGTLINEDTVLTAAHCFYLDSPQNLTVKINAHDFNRPTPRERVVKVRQIIIHPGWNRREYSNDSLILKLAEHVRESRTVKYSKLPARQGHDIVQDGDLCYVVGWGTVNRFGGPSTTLLQKGAMRLISNTECRAKKNEAKQFKWIGPMHICAKSAYVRTSFCNGDSGGPLFCYPRSKPGTVIQVGVVSYGYFSCGTKDMPMAFARVSYFLDWIKAQM